MQIEKDPSGMPPLLGFGVGDGCMGIGSIGGCGMDSQRIFWDFMYGHSQMSTSAYNNLNNICGSSLNYGNETAECRQAINKATTNLGGFNVYNIYDECYLRNDEVTKTSKIYRDRYGNIRQSLHNGFNGQQLFNKGSPDGLGEGINQYACGGSKVSSIYLNNNDVKKAINVPQIPWTWQDGDWSKYTSTQTSLIPYYKEWVNKYRILIYYGDVDSGVPYNGGEEWTVSLGYPIKESWRPWSTNGAELMAGYVQIFDTNNTNFTYCTVRGAGHMVPQFKPEEALKMYEIFLSDGTWPPYVGPIGGGLL